MNKRFYPKMAWSCLRKNRRFYTPYLVTVMGAAAGFYMLATTAGSNGLSDAGDVRLIMKAAAVVLGFLCAGFLLYANGFLMKQRGREFGLYSVLGMTRANLARLLLWETVYTALIGVGGGLLLGVIFDRLLLLTLAWLMGLALTGPVIYGQCLIITGLVFGGILLLIFIVNGARVGLMRPADLMTSQNAGDRVPRARWLIALAGLASLGAGYAIAIAVPAGMSGVDVDIIQMFFIAVLLVIAGTFLLFLAGTVTGLMALRRWKGYYYKARHFIAVSGLIHRMGRGAAGLAIICILSTAVLVMVSSTVCLYAGLEDTVSRRFPRDVLCEFGSDTEADWDGLLDEALASARAEGYHPENAVRYMLWQYSDDQHTKPLFFVDRAGYEAITGQTVSLEPGQVLATCPGGTLTVLYDTVDVAGHLPADDPAAAYLTQALGLSSAIGVDCDLVVAGTDAIETLWDAAWNYDCYDHENGLPDGFAYSSYIMHHMDFDLPAGEDSHRCRNAVSGL